MSSVQLYPSLNSQIPQNFAFQKISRKSKTSLDDWSVLETLNNSKIVSVTETSLFDFPNFPEAKKSFQVYYFELSEAYQIHSALFKSFVSSGRPEGVIIDINKDLGNFTLKFYASNTAIVKAYLKKIFEFLDDEIRFKAILRKVLGNQIRNKAEEQLLNKEYFSTK